MIDAEILKRTICSKFQIKGNNLLKFKQIQAIQDADINDIIWISPKNLDKEQIINSTKAGGIICNQETFHLYKGDISLKLFLISSDPKSIFVDCVRFFSQQLEEIEKATIHPTAIIHKNCKIGNNVSIGAYSIIGDCVIGDNTIIHEHVKFFNGVIIGENCLIREFCSIGGAGFGYHKSKNNSNEHIPHVGKVIIGDNVHLYPYVNVDRGTLGKTEIKSGTVVDHYVHIGHNSLTGHNNIITAGSVLAGGAIVNDNCFLGLKTIVKEKCVIGSNVITGMGSVVVKNIPSNEVWIGNPAKFYKTNDPNENS